MLGSAVRAALLESSLVKNASYTPTVIIEISKDFQRNNEYTRVEEHPLIFATICFKSLELEHVVYLHWRRLWAKIFNLESGIPSIITLRAPMGKEVLRDER